MATLRETLRQNRATSNQLVRGPSGVLQETSTEEVQKLAGKAGLPVPPTDALSTAAIGGTPKQQDMAGSANQMQAALRIAQQPEQSLAAAMRREQPRAEASEQELLQQKKSKDLQDLGQLGDRVNLFIENARKDLEKAEIDATKMEVAPQEGTAAAGITDATQQKQLIDAAKALLKNPNDMNAQLTINQILGKSVTETIKPEELMKLYEDATKTLARSGAATVEDDLQVEDLIAMGDFPYDLPQLESLLGIPGAELSKYSVAQLRNQLNAVADAEFSKTQQLEQKAVSGLAGAAERQLARGLARESSRTGMRSTEQDVSNLEQQIENADQVQFAGQTYQVDELLKDDTISGIITDYFKMTDVERAELEKTEPELVSFIKKNEAILDDASKAMGAGAEQFQAIQTANQQLANVGGETLDPELMKTILPGFGELQAGKLDPMKSPVFQQIQTLAPAQQKQMAQNLNQLAVDADLKQFLPELANLSVSDVKALNLDKPSPATLSNLKANVQTVNALNNMDPTTDVDAIVTAFTGMPDPAKAQQEVTKNFAANVLGLGGNDISMFDSNKDGKIDNAETLLNTMKKSTSKPSLLDAAKGTIKTYQPKEVPTYEPTKDSLENTVFSKLSKAASDGKITAEEIQAAGFDDYNLLDIQEAGLHNKWGEAGKTVNNMISRARDIETNLALKDFQIPPVPDLTQAANLAPKDTFTTVFGAEFKVPSVAAIDKLRASADPIKQSIETLKAQIRLWEIGAKGTDHDPRKVDMTKLRKRVEELRNQVDLIYLRAGELQAKRDEELDLIKQYESLSGTPEGGKSQGVVGGLAKTAGGGLVKSVKEGGGKISKTVKSWGK